MKATPDTADCTFYEGYSPIEQFPQGHGTAVSLPAGSIKFQIPNPKFPQSQIFQSKI
ncbi:MAG: hypothetical protein ACRC62_34855 [Microcoleus sp.]